MMAIPSPPLCDPKLRHLNISFWTRVQISNELASRMISLYLETDHPLLGTFAGDLFVSDLVSQKSEYCSAVMVNALLYWACVGLSLREAVIFAMKMGG